MKKQPNTNPLYKALMSMSVSSDGRSDSVPAVIDGKQPAALSEGEYVLTAPVVAYLGRGSSRAGIELLDKFQKFIQQKIKEDGMVYEKPAKE